MIYLADPDVTLYHGDALEVLRTLPSESVHCCVTSPPFYALRDYSACSCVREGRLEIHEDERGDRHTAGGAIAFHRQREPNPDCPDCSGTGKRADMAEQIGLEKTPEQWVARLVEVFREVRRVLRRDGTLWLEVGDSYNGSGGTGKEGGKRRSGEAYQGTMDGGRHVALNVKHKDLIGAPWLLAFALRADGWYLRSDIVWARPNPMPESVTDRPTKSHSYVFLLTKSPRYFFDQEAVREPNDAVHMRWTKVKRQTVGGEGEFGVKQGAFNRAIADGSEAVGRNIRSVWQIATQPFAAAHFATFPEELARRCIAAGTSERGCCPECGAPWVRELSKRPDKPSSLYAKRSADESNDTNVQGGFRTDGVLRQTGSKMQKWLDENPVTTLGWRPSCNCRGAWGTTYPKPCTVLDPFVGSGTVPYVARKLGRRAIGIDLSAEYLELASKRLAQQSLFAEVPA
jgi:DNA modification methylase